MLFFHRSKPGVWYVRSVALTACLALASCAAIPTFSTLDYAHNTVSAVESGTPQGDATNAVNEAKAKLILAEQSRDRGEVAQAEQYAQEAVANAEYASALNRRERTNQELQLLEANFQNLQRELEWREPLNIEPLQ